MVVVHEPDLPYRPLQHWASVIMRVLVLIASGVFLYDGDWEAALGALLIFALMLTPTIARRRYRVQIPFAIDFGVVFFVFTTLFLGHLLRFYEIYPLWDKFLHLQSGLILSVTGFFLVYVLNESESTSLDLSPAFVALFAVTFSVTVGVVWEMIEFVGDGFSTAGYWQGMSGTNADTMWDLIADTAGSLIVSIAGWYWMHRYKKIPFAPKLLARIRKIARKRIEA
jgi:hypothetical protein